MTGESIGTDNENSDNSMVYYTPNISWK